MHLHSRKAAALPAVMLTMCAPLRAGRDRIQPGRPTAAPSQAAAQQLPVIVKLRRDGAGAAMAKMSNGATSCRGARQTDRTRVAVHGARFRTACWPGTSRSVTPVPQRYSRGLRAEAAVEYVVIDRGGSRTPPTQRYAVRQPVVPAEHRGFGGQCHRRMGPRARLGGHGRRRARHGRVVRPSRSRSRRSRRQIAARIRLRDADPMGTMAWRAIPTRPILATGSTMPTRPIRLHELRRHRQLLARHPRRRNDRRHDQQLRRRVRPDWNSFILPVRVLGKCGGTDSDILAGMRWAAGLTVRCAGQSDARPHPQHEPWSTAPASRAIGRHR